MITFLNVDEFIKKMKLKGPISSPLIRVGKSNNFHPEGLFSEEIFGIEGSEEYYKGLSWIELNCKVINPFIYDIMKKRIERKIGDLISGEKRYSLDKKGFLVEDKNGNIYGMSSFIDNIENIRFREVDDEDTDINIRNKVISKLYEYIDNGVFFIDKIIVISPYYRPINILPNGKESLDMMNDIYIEIINLSIQMEGIQGKMKDILSYRMQNVLMKMLDYVRNQLSKKFGIIRNLMLGRTSDFSARAVISPNPNIGIGYVGIPLRIACQIFEPFMLYGFVNSPYAKNIPKEFYEEARKFLNKESLY